MHNYTDFILENIINESILYITSDLKKTLSKIGDDISKDLLSIVGDDIKQDITFLDIDEEDRIKFSTMRNFKKSISDIDTTLSIDTKYNGSLIEYLENNDKYLEIGGARSRNSVKIGRLVNQIFPKKYNAKEVEEFVNKFKSVMNGTSVKLEIISGDDIEFWYNSENYVEIKGSLGGSCMANKKGIFDLYTKNENCQLLILKDGNKIKGRALVWKLKYLKIDGVEHNDIYFLDRQYTNDDSDAYTFKEYAKDKGWVIKARNSHSNLESVVYKGVEYSYSEMCVEAPNIKLNKFPYVDTFRLYNPDKYMLYNTDTEETGTEDYVGCYNLDDTSGGYSEINNDLYSSYYECTIDEESAVWSDYHDSYLNRYDSVHVEGDWFPDDSDAIQYCDYRDTHFMSQDCTYTEYDDESYLSDDVIKCITDITISSVSDTDYIYKGHDDIATIESIRFSKECIDKLEIEEEYILLELISEINDKRYESETTIKSFIIEVFKIRNEEGLYLPKLVADHFGLKIDKEEKLTTDMFFFCKENRENNYKIKLYDIAEFVTEDDVVNRLREIILEYYI